ncbi:hypothetical protein [Pedobacter duraquae]|uniref:Uncharacterized protein n=1 Tax=Pedobacter duraquae TaxID=425511 RepID=A0A4R6IIR5_9SPHI|nr:hypothetical protein [Pedobacter duraquae]TDO21874.1 hypothetical protein CLV32_2982 [Pedobacter duraquae]
MRRVILLFAAVTMFSSCGIFSKVFKHKTSESILEESNYSEKKDSAVFNSDRSKIVITETLDTTITTPERKGAVKAKLDLAALQLGLQIYDDEFITLNQIYNPVDSTLKTSYTIKPANVLVPKTRRTEIDNDKKSSAKIGSENKGSAKTEQKKADVIVERKPDYTVVIIVVVLVLLFVFLMFGRSWANLLKNNFIKN